MKDYISIDVLLSSFGSIEGGIILLNPKGDVIYINDWVIDNSVIDIKGYSGRRLNDLFQQELSESLLKSVDEAIHSSLSRVLSHKLHKKIFPLYRDKAVSDAHALDLSVFISPLKDMTGVLIRIVDYSSLVKKEKQIKVNESLLTIEKDYFIKASDPKINTEQFVSALIKSISCKLSFVSIDFSLMKKGETLRYPKDSQDSLLLECEKIIQHKVFEGSDLTQKMMTIGSEHNKDLSIIDFSDEKIKGVLALSKRTNTVVDVVYEKSLVKIKDLMLGLIEWKINYEKLNYMAVHDNLTGLYNRSYLLEKFECFKKQFEMGNIKSFSVFFVDLNKFKQINDTYGHRYGDKVLIKVAQKIKSSLDLEEGAVFRIGGDEFVVIKEEFNPAQYIESLKEKIASPFLCEANIMSVTASIGFADFPENGRSLDEIMHVADEKMYIQK